MVKLKKQLNDHYYLRIYIFKFGDSKFEKNLKSKSCVNLQHYQPMEKNMISNMYINI